MCLGMGVGICDLVMYFMVAMVSMYITSWYYTAIAPPTQTIVVQRTLFDPAPVTEDLQKFGQGFAGNQEAVGLIRTLLKAAANML